MRFLIALSVACLLCMKSFAGSSSRELGRQIRLFAEGYAALGVPSTSYDYADYFKAIPPRAELLKQQNFFEAQKAALRPLLPVKLSLEDAIRRDHLRYEIDFNLDRLSLELAWDADGRPIPSGGLHGLRQHEAWYRLFIRRYTGLALSPDDILRLGKQEADRVQREIRRIRQSLRFTDSAAFYRTLAADSFFITDRAEVVRRFEQTDSTIRRHLADFIGPAQIPKIYPMEWPDATANTPPGIYLNSDYNPYGKDVFQYNFYGGRYNRRAVEWLYMHEAIPGHHLQSSMRATSTPDALQAAFMYPGNFEGWACYVEYRGKELGMYKDVFSELGKWEWDLVRSARLVMDAGIHHLGWTRVQVLAYWQQEVPGQEGIAEREASRVTAWTAQALSYKAGADCIERLRQEMRSKHGAAFSDVAFHQAYLAFGMRPLEVIQRHFEEMYAWVAAHPVHVNKR